MRIRLIAVGTKMPDWVEQGYGEYAKRLPRDCTVELVELPLGPRGKSSSTAVAMEREGQSMMAAIGKGDRVIALDVKGKAWSTEQLARNLDEWRMSGANYSLLIGGPDGLAPECLALAEAKWSLSALTLPHPLVRILVIEQLYRAYSILHNHPYHK
ncbi:MULTISPECIES: 23S rRNA (pseudouridine(1915)-N(3))-methyltransferase RlmH [Marinimicrobium]|jgi:23S rRNA (pseudouridine1915-N3)-methyltransferase|uniref:Ribosomal RNA large subunit methyltransferase H n=1 Tax=Marinimicrobium koreense TaxID=306545 RepID=A0A3N1P0A3_9GAMM|nr:MULTISPECIES: 23S rRNA (pseudouridine(1915)-N(3))-methyltransferase RlmH [Marinimicrobium]MAN52410.1 23S rRNA (pseudouridine(1915)-N(3))-methyltransferase RlmH [Marinimicrobium sp.]ROQ21028.1 23S rRNA (pseudouridine1915-N3)-methyltransferase [Marinimicrobium koreense]